MTLEQRIVSLAQAIGTDIKNISAITGAFDFATATEEEVLQYKQGKWKNTPKETITDGGNF